MASVPPLQSGEFCVVEADALIAWVASFFARFRLKCLAPGVNPGIQWLSVLMNVNDMNGVAPGPAI